VVIVVQKPRSTSAGGDYQALVSFQVRRRKLYEQVVDQIEAAILEGQLAQGSTLPSERELMQLFGVGRTAIREALFALERRGFVALNNGECARVSSPDPGTIVAELSSAAKRFLKEPSGVRHFQQARIMLESGLARYAARSVTKSQLLKLRKALQANKEAIGNQARFDLTDIDFHFVIAEISGNPIFSTLHKALGEWLYEQRTIAGTAKGGPNIAYLAHAKIYEAIARKDENAAGEAMTEHLEEISRRYWKQRKRMEAMDAARNDSRPSNRDQSRNKFSRYSSGS